MRIRFHIPVGLQGNGTVYVPSAELNRLSGYRTPQAVPASLSIISLPPMAPDGPHFRPLIDRHPSAALMRGPILKTMSSMGDVWFKTAYLYDGMQTLIGFLVQPLQAIVSQNPVLPTSGTISDAILTPSGQAASRYPRKHPYFWL